MFIQSWKSLALRGAIGLSFGIFALVRPGMTLAALVLGFGVYALLDGIAAIVLGTRDRARERAWAFTLEGFAGVGLGLAIVVWTRTAAEVLVLVIAFWAILTGILELFALIRLRREVPGEVLLGVAGVASTALGLTILFRPALGAFALVALLGSYAFVFGVAMLLQAARARALSMSTQKSHTGRRHSLSIR